MSREDWIYCELAFWRLVLPCSLESCKNGLKWRLWHFPWGNISQVGKYHCQNCFVIFNLDSLLLWLYQYQIVEKEKRMKMEIKKKKEENKEKVKYAEMWLFWLVLLELVILDCVKKIGFTEHQQNKQENKRVVEYKVGHTWSNLLSFRLSFSSAQHWKKERGRIKRSERFVAMSQLLSTSVGFFPQCLFHAIKSYSFFFITKFSFKPFSYLH